MTDEIERAVHLAAGPEVVWVEQAQPPSNEHRGMLTIWWQATGEPASRVSIKLTPTPDGTRLRVVEARPLEILDLTVIPLTDPGRGSRGPALIAA
jgi:hypothetical protein